MAFDGVGCESFLRFGRLPPFSADAPPAEVDPTFERKPDNRLAVSIRRATPLACGR
jgi:hypothetical protein